MPIQQMLLGLGAAGDKYWYLIFGNTSSNTETFQDLVMDSDDNIYVVGYNFGGSQGSSDHLSAKFDKEGALQWQNGAGTSGYDALFSCTLDNSKNLYMYGVSDYKKYFGKRTASSPSSLSYQKKWHWGNTTGIKAVESNSSNQIYVGLQGSGSGLGAARVLRTNTSMGLYDQRQFHYSNKSININDLCIDSSGNVIVVGTGPDHPWPGGGGVDTQMGFVIKFNSGLTEQWQKLIGGSGATNINGCSTDSSDNIYVVGTDVTGGNGSVVAKINSSGSLQWQRKITNNDFRGGTFDCVNDSSDNLYVIGKAASGQYGWINKWNSSGTLQWGRVWKTSTSGDEQDFSRIKLDSNENLVISGSHYDGERTAMLLKLPNDGSLTGTHGIFTYAVSTPGVATPTMQFGNGPYTFDNPSTSFDNLSLTSYNPNFNTPTVVDID